MRTGELVYIIDSQRNPIAQPAIVIDAPQDAWVRVQVTVLVEAVAQGQKPGEQIVAVPLANVWTEAQMRKLYQFFMEEFIPF